MSPPGAHTYQISEDNPEDPVEKMLDRTGCAQLHYDLQFCMADKKDWRACQDLVKALKECMNQQRVQRDGATSQESPRRQ